MSHVNAALTPRARLRLARLVVESGWTYAAAAKMFMVSPKTAKKWADRFRAEGASGMVDRSSRPRVSPSKTGPKAVRRIVRMRWRHRLGPVQIAGRLGTPAATVHAVLTRCRINRLSRIDRVTGEPLRRYEHDAPGALIHVDVTKFANIPDGGGHKFLSRRQGRRNKQQTAHRTGERGADYRPRIGIAYLHTVIDDHSHVAYAETNRRKGKHRNRCPAQRRGLVRRPRCRRARVLSDNGSAYKSYAWRDACTELNITPKRTRPYRPRPTAKSNDSTAPWPTAGPTPGTTSPPNNATTALSGWLHFYNHHRHSAIGGRPPVTRLTNLPGHHT